MKLKNAIVKPCYCKACFSLFYPSPLRQLIEREPLLCDSCISKIEKKLDVVKISNVNVLFLSRYDGLMKSWLMNYKEYKDVELAPCFLSLFLPLIRILYPRHLFLPLPSNEIRRKERGFDHLSLMLETSHLSYQNVFFLDSMIEQKRRNGSDKHAKRGISLRVDPDFFRNKRVVLFDDVMTTGSTFLECLDLLKTTQVKKVSGLILLDNYHKSKLSYEQ